MSISTYMANMLLNAVFRGETLTVSGVYLSVHTSNPGKTGGGEAVGGSYSRQPASFTVAFGGTIVNDADVTFPYVPSGEYNYTGVWDAAAGGNYLWGSTFLEPELCAEGEGIILYSGCLYYTLS